jgi:hypothetical protein
MSQIRPKILLRYGRINEPIRIPISDQLVDPLAQTFLSADSVPSVTVISVANITGFAINQILLIGEPGNQNSEIVKTSATVAPATGQVTLTAGTVYGHTASTPVYRLYFDQIEISNAPTIAGTKTVLTGMPITIVANDNETDFNDSVSSGGYYFARFKNSITATFSDYSDPAPYGGYTILSARSIIDSALGMINKTILPNGTLTDEYAFQQIDACQMETLREFKRWSFMQSFDTIIGTTQTGTWKVAMPDNLDDKVTYKSVYNFRIGKEPDMQWVDKEEWDALIEGMAYSTLAVQANPGDMTLTLTNSKDFSDSGTIQVGPNQYTWTVNTKSTGVLTLGSAVLDIALINQDVFQFGNLGWPSYWTIWNGFIYHWPGIGSTYTGRNYYMDYYIKLTQITSDYQSIVLPDPTVVQYYLAWKFLLRLNNGEDNTATQAMYNQYILRREKMKQKESINRNFILNPDIVDNYDSGG